MLNYLNVKNLAVAERASAVFREGLTVVTGETGSGKSVIIGALGLVLGERADHSMVRTGEKELSVEASFTVPEGDIGLLLEEAGLPPCEDGQLVIRRTVPAQGAGRCWINDSPSTTSTLKRLGAFLVDMHGPYDHQSLLLPEKQLRILDSYAGVGQEAGAYAKEYSKYLSLLRERGVLRGESAQSAEEEMERLRYVEEEIREAALTEEDGDPLLERHMEASNASSIIEAASFAADRLSDGEESVFDAMALVSHRLLELSRVYRPAEDWHREAEAICLSVQELSRTVSDALQKIDPEPGLLESLEARMEVVQRLKRKYGPTISDVLARGKRAGERLAALEGRLRRMEEIDAEISLQERAVMAAGEKLGEARRRAAGVLSREISDELKTLGFGQARFGISFAACKPAASGTDSVSFLFAPNAGEEARPLSQIASSGEIARVMLAVKSVLADHDPVLLMVFDEIDSNIGGETGRAVGRKLRELGKHRQVLSITHLPQVAAFGENHFAVRKEVRDGRTVAEICELDEESRPRELARMLGGSGITSVVLEHARELLRSGAI